MIGKCRCSNLGLGTVLTVMVVFGGEVRAEHTRYYDVEGFGALLNGNPESTAISEEGAITLPPDISVFNDKIGHSIITATPYKEGILVATSEDSFIRWLQPNGETKKIAQIPSPMITKLLVMGEDIYAAGGPPAKLYKVNMDGKIEVVFEPEADFIWSVAAAINDKDLWIGTGAPGLLFQLNGKREAELVFAPEQDHVRVVEESKDFGVFVGTSGSGVLYRRAPQSSAFTALCDTRHGEITDLTVVGNRLVVAAVSGADKLPRLEASAGGKVEAKDGKSEVRSQLISVSMTGTTEVLAGSDDEAVFAVESWKDGAVLVATAVANHRNPRGRLYEISVAARSVSLVYQSSAKRLVGLMSRADGSRVMLSAGPSRLDVLGRDYAHEGEYLSKPFDAEINARFGLLSLFGHVPSRTRAQVAIRTGQTAYPDDSWSDWSGYMSYPGSAPKGDYTGRFMQLKIRLRGNGEVVPTIHRYRAAYLRENLPPFVREVVALRKNVAMHAVPGEPGKSKMVNLKEKISLADRLDTKLSQMTKKPRRLKAKQLEKRGALTVRWSAEDPNGDKLRYNLSVRSRNAGAWRSLDEDMEYPFYTMDSSQFADGVYQFRVEVSDAVSNPMGLERMDVRESRSVLVDNTPPSLSKPRVKVRGRRARVTLDATDNIGPFAGMAFSVNGAGFRMLNPKDGVLDGPEESFELNLGELEVGTHVLNFKASDAAGNLGYVTTRFEISR
ncbi:MAG: hypothetical protein VYA34_14340 [Myxococcota bacterium]|nr:hypothetical protein [Myxococcota bacterium]